MTWLLPALYLAAVVVDLLALRPFPMTPLYAVPVILAANRLSIRAVAGWSALAVISNIGSSIWQKTPLSIAVFYTAGLALIGLVALMLAGQRAQTAAREREAAAARAVAERLLEESEARVRALVDGETDAVMLVTLNGIVLANEAAAGIAGVATPRDLIGRKWADFIHPDDLADALMVRSARQRGELRPARYACRVRSDGGAVRDTEVVSIGVQYRGNQASVVIVRDLSAEKAAQAEREARHRLDGAMLVARTVAHSLNNALVPVSTYAELLTTSPVVEHDSRARGYVQEILEGARAAAEQVRQLQHIIRLEETVTVLGPDRPLLDVERSTSPAPVTTSASS